MDVAEATKELRRNLEQHQGMRERGAGVNRFFDSVPSSNAASSAPSSASSISLHPEDWLVDFEGVWIHNPELGHARRRANAELFAGALPQTSPIATLGALPQTSSRAQLIHTTTTNDAPPSTINDAPPSPINDTPPSSMEGPFQPMKPFGYDSSRNPGHWTEQTKDYIIWQLR